MLVLALDTATTDLVAGLAEVSDPADPASATSCEVIAESVTATRAHNESCSSPR